MPGTYYFVILNPNDVPLYEYEHPSDSKNDDLRHLNQFLSHAALDIVDEQIWTSNSMYLKVVDKFNEMYISAFVTASRFRFIVVHNEKNEEGIKSFCQEIYESFIKLSINPFTNMDTAIQSSAFTKKINLIAKKFLS